MTSEPQEELEKSLLVLRTKRNDEAAWRILVKQMWPFIFSAISRSLGTSNEEDIRDATQDVISRLFRYCPFDRIEGVRAFRSYVLAVSRHVAFDSLRSRGKRKTETGLEELVERAQQPEEPRRDLKILLDEMLQTLSEEDRAVVKMFIEGYSLSEIARSLGKTYAQIAMRLHRIRQELREQAKRDE